MESLNTIEMHQISGGKNDNMTVNLSLDVPAADAAFFTDLYAKISANTMTLTEFGQAIADAKITGVSFSNFHLSGLHFSKTDAHPATGK